MSRNLCDAEKTCLSRYSAGGVDDVDDGNDDGGNDDSTQVGQRRHPSQGDSQPSLPWPEEQGRIQVGGKEGQ